ncbi:outer membrane protein [Paracoccus pacificus]|uniref:Outer membrane protein n=1 Tax=Paracoccus pacificus TaxID=1463598 RepID=A0ABW4R687_9RHOB
MVKTSLNAMVFAAAAASVVGSGAVAGGFTPAVEEVAPIVEVAPALPMWQGGYVGGTLGYAFSGDDRVGLSPNAGGASYDVDKLKLSGLNGGIRAGYRWQRNAWVFGTELGIEGGNVKDSFSTDGYDGSMKVKNVLALRSKIGRAMDNGLLVYGIGGIARGKFDYSVEGTGPAGVANINESFSKTGYIVGLGVEKMINERMSITGEYEYANFGKTELNGTSGLATRATPDYHNIKVGVNFRF